jgi:hypothetical protein
VEYILALIESISTDMPSASGLADPKEYQKIFHWAETQKDGSIPSFATRRNDPYKVCANPLRNRFQLLTSIAVPSWF